MSSMQALTSPRISFNRGTERRAHGQAALLVAVGLFLVVLLVEAALIATAAPSVSDLSSLYTTVT